MPWKAFIEKEPFSGRAKLRIGRQEADGAYAIVQPLVLKRHERGTMAGEEEIAVSGDGWGEGEVRNFLQAMVDLAWQEGIRPTGVEDYRGELRAVREHLADMRTLALKTA